jgi:oxygen-dependent protoporphyrinogen oxidase
MGGTLLSFAGGMEELPRRLAGRLGALLRTDARVQRLTHAGAAWRLEIERGSPVECEHVVLACAPLQAAALLRSLDHTLAELLERMPVAPLAVMALGFHDRDVAHVERGFGFLVPTRERLGILGTMFDSWLFPERAPHDRVLWRCLIGGARDRGAIDLDDDALVQRATAALGKLLQVRAAPVMTGVVRHVEGIPQYALGHLQRMTQIDELLARHPGLVLAGHAYRGTGVNACIREAERLAARWGTSPDEVV